MIIGHFFGGALVLGLRKSSAPFFAGFGGGMMKALLDCAVVVDSQNMQQVEDAHVILAHLLFLDLKARIEATAESLAAKS